MSKYSSTTVALALLVAAPAIAGEAKNPTPRQMAHCVMARVKTNPSESYKVAYRTCRDEFGSPSDPRAQTAMNSINAWDKPAN